MLTYFRLALATLRRVTRTRGDLLLENLALRQQLAMYERSRLLLTHPTRTRLGRGWCARSATGPALAPSSVGRSMVDGSCEGTD